MMRDRVWFTIKRDFLPIRIPSHFLANVNTKYRGENCEKFICKSYFVGSKERITNVDIQSVDVSIKFYFEVWLACEIFFHGDDWHDLQEMINPEMLHVYSHLFINIKTFPDFI